ncbi:MAG: ATP-binding protein [Armatimonadetes bacterium]|nr:ATP-binding protein [Armatimonadota bacterium]
MRINTGAALSPSDVVGRGRVIAQLWRDLDNQSVVLNAERRMGKTSLIKKMCAESPTDVIALYRDLENIQTPEAFLEAILADLHEQLPDKRRAKEMFLRLRESLGGVEIKGIFKLPPAQQRDWELTLKTILVETAQAVEGRIVFFWDEIPLMLDNMKRGKNGAAVAMQVLSALRAIRHDDKTKSIRMVFTGSIGLHHILTELRGKGLNHPAINDMSSELLPPLSEEDAVNLVTALLAGANIPVSGSKAQEIAASVDNIPFYIQHLAKGVRDHQNGADVALANIPELRYKLLYSPQDPLYLRHYRERIEIYYAKKEGETAFLILDALAHEQPLLVDTLLNRVKLKAPKTKEQSLFEILELLEQDLYIERSARGYQFQRNFIRDAWKALRNIA